MLPSSEETVEVVMLTPQKRVQQQAVEQITDVSVMTHKQVPMIQNTVEIPQAQFVDKMMDVSAVATPTTTQSASPEDRRSS